MIIKITINTEKEEKIICALSKFKRIIHTIPPVLEGKWKGDND